MIIKQNRIVENFIEMAKISSLSLNERKMADYLIGKLKKLGLDVYEDKVGEIIKGNAGNVVGILKGELDCQVMFSAHMDTVGPCDGVKPIIKNGRIESSKDTILGSDDKAGIAAIIELIEVIVENKIKTPTIIVIFSVAEEIRLLGAKYFDASNYNIRYGFILDSSGKPGTVVNKAPYQDHLKIIVKGKAAHAGIEPEKGLNALYAASKAISKLKVGRIDEETTFNIGIVNGGIATNIVMEKVEFLCECRSFREEKLKQTGERIIKIFKEEVEKEGGSVEFNIQREYDGFDFPEEYELIKIVKKSAEKKGLQFKAHALGGGSDTNAYNSKGINTINLGIGMAEVHSVEEYIEISDLENMSMLLVEIVKELSGNEFEKEF